jgi:hypothetical protein
MMRIRLLLLTALFLLPSPVRAQSKADFTLAFTIDNNQSALSLEISRAEIPFNFSIPTIVQANTGLYRLVDPDTPKVHASKILCAFNGIDASDAVAALLITPAKACMQNSSNLFPLNEGSYLLEIKAAALCHLGEADCLAGRTTAQPPLKDVYLPFTVSKEASEKLSTAGNIIRQHQEVRLAPDVPVNTVGLSTVQLQRVTLRVATNNDIDELKQTLKATYIANKGRQPSRFFGGTLDFRLATSLSDGQQYLLRGPDNLVDAWGRPLKIEGKLKLPDVPKSDDDSKIVGTLSMQAAVHQKAVFALTGKYSPLIRDYLGGGKDHPGYPDYWDPSLNVDVGLRSTKSANSIIATGLYCHWIDCKTAPAATPPEQFWLPTRTG